MAKDEKDRSAAAASLEKKLEGLSFWLTQDELDELGGVLEASGAVAPRQRAFTLNTAAYSKSDACW